MIFENATQFSLYIEEQTQRNESNYMEEIVSYCNQNMIEYEDIVKLISPSLKEKIRIEASKEYLMPTLTHETLEFDEDELDGFQIGSDDDYSNE